MLVFAGIWTICDKNGVFEYRPRQMKLDILPFLDFDLTNTIETLKDAGFIVLYECNGEKYGQVPSFKEHQRITGREALEGGKHPEHTQGNNRETTRKQQGNNADRHVAQEGKGREKEGSGGSGNNGETLPPTLLEIREHTPTAAYAKKFFDHYTAHGWKTSKGAHIVDWRAKLAEWMAKDQVKPPGAKPKNYHPPTKEPQSPGVLKGEDAERVKEVYKKLKIPFNMKVEK